MKQPRLLQTWMEHRIYGMLSLFCHHLPQLLLPALPGLGPLNLWALPHPFSNFLTHTPPPVNLSLLLPPHFPTTLLSGLTHSLCSPFLFIMAVWLLEVSSSKSSNCLSQQLLMRLHLSLIPARFTNASYNVVSCVSLFYMKE
jgi:hypothetical protein